MSEDQHITQLRGRRGLDGWLVELFDAEHLDDTCQVLAKAAQPDEEEESRREEMRRRIIKLDGELDAYRTVLRNEPDAAATVGRWIAATIQEPRRFETVLGGQSTTRLSREDIKALVESLRDITATLTEADPAHKAAIYAEMGIEVTYHADGRVLVESRPGVVSDGVGGASATPSTRDPWETVLELAI